MRFSCGSIPYTLGRTVKDWRGIILKFTQLLTHAPTFMGSSEPWFIILFGNPYPCNILYA